MAVGRPTVYDPAMREKVIEVMAEGGSKLEAGAAIGLKSEGTIYEWIKKYPEFSEAVKEGELLSKVWWEKHGRTNLYNNKFNSKLWFMNMKNRSGWSDRTESTNIVVVDESAKRVRDAADQYAKDH